MDKLVGFLSLDAPLWSNIEGILNTVAEERLKQGGCYAQHAAWNYCGYVWYDPSLDTWYEQIWVHREHVETLSGDSATNVIAQALAKHGVM